MCGSVACAPSDSVGEAGRKVSASSVSMPVEQILHGRIHDSPKRSDIHNSAISFYSHACALGMSVL